MPGPFVEGSTRRVDTTYPSRKERDGRGGLAHPAFDTLFFWEGLKVLTHAVHESEWKTEWTLEIRYHSYYFHSCWMSHHECMSLRAFLVQEKEWRYLWKKGVWKINQRDSCLAFFCSLPRRPLLHFRFRQYGLFC